MYVRILRNIFWGGYAPTLKFCYNEATRSPGMSAREVHGLLVEEKRNAKVSELIDLFSRWHITDDELRLERVS